MLYDEISTCDFIFNVKVNPNGSISGLFFCHQKSADLARRFNVVFVMDCTFKTNRFGMLLLNILGIMATNSTFNAGFAFICNETERGFAFQIWICVHSQNEGALFRGGKQRFPRLIIKTFSLEIYLINNNSFKIKHSMNKLT